MPDICNKRNRCLHEATATYDRERSATCKRGQCMLNALDGVVSP